MAKQPKKDLALLRLARLPNGVLPLPIARTSVQSGDQFHAVGHPPEGEACWVYTRGTVRTVHEKKWKIDNKAVVNPWADAKLVQAQLPVSCTFSDAPRVNDHTELVGLGIAEMEPRSLHDAWLNLSEIRPFLQDYYTSGSRRARAGLDAVNGKDKTALAKILREDTDAGLCLGAALALGRMGPEATAAVPVLLGAFKDNDDLVRTCAAERSGYDTSADTVTTLQR